MSIVLLALAFTAHDALPDRDSVRAPAFARAGLQCQNARNHLAEVPPKAFLPRKLGDQPVADQYLTVLRLQGGCDKPIKVRQGIGDGIEDQR